MTDALAAEVRALQVPPGEAPRLGHRETASTLGLSSKDEGEAHLRDLTVRIGELQERLWAEGERALLLVLQGMDTSGKDGTIRHVLREVNPQGCRIAGFRAPSELELAHDFLWRVHRESPRRGEIGVFNRSHYEDVVVVRVLSLVTEQRWRARFRHITEFERLLVDEGTVVVKVFLHISKDEQGERLRDRLEEPDKRWKFNPRDLEHRARWDDFQAAYEEAITHTGSEHAPWHVVPADRKWVRNVAVAHLLTDALTAMDPRFPQPDDLSDIVIE